MNEWAMVNLADVAQPKGLVGGPFGSKLVSKDYVEHGTAVIRGQNLGSGRWVSFSDCVYVTNEKVERDLRGNIAAPGDLVYTQRGTLGQVAMMRPGAPAAVISQSQMRLRVETARVDPMYVYYWSCSDHFRKSIADHAIVAGVPHINLRILGSLPIGLPPLPTQRRIAYIFGTIDDLIENNSRRIDVLEEMARAIYREWFVNFRYPGHGEVPLVDHAHGSIPQGWTWGRLDCLVQVVKDNVDPSALDPGTPAVGLEHIPRNRLTLDDWGVAGKQGSRKSVFSRGDILFGKIRPYFHKVSIAPVDGISSTDAIVIRPMTQHWGQVALLVSSTAFVAHATQTSNGTKMPRADWKVLGQWPVAVPCSGLSDSFNGIVREQLELAEKLMFENRRLSQLRDLMLPKLVTGEMDVSAVDLDSLIAEWSAS